MSQLHVSGHLSFPRLHGLSPSLDARHDELIDNQHAKHKDDGNDKERQEVDHAICTATSVEALLPEGLATVAALIAAVTPAVFVTLIL